MERVDSTNNNVMLKAVNDTFCKSRTDKSLSTSDTTLVILWYSHRDSDSLARSFRHVTTRFHTDLTVRNLICICFYLRFSNLNDFSVCYYRVWTVHVMECCKNCLIFVIVFINLIWIKVVNKLGIFHFDGGDNLTEENLVFHGINFVMSCCSGIVV